MTKAPIDTSIRYEVEKCPALQNAEHSSIAYSTGNSTQYSVITYMGKESEKRIDNMYMYN